MVIVYTDRQYNYWMGWSDNILTRVKEENGKTYACSKGCGYYYNVLPKWVKNADAGYPDSDYICKIKGVKNIFKEIEL